MDLQKLLLVLLLMGAVGVKTEAQKIHAPETVTVQSGTLTLRGLLWRPTGRGPFPAVLFNHGSGPANYPQKPAALGPVFAKHGYIFLYLYRRGAGLSADDGSNSGALMAKALAENGQEGRNELQLKLLETELEDVLSGLAFLRACAEVDARRVAIAGHSFGGSLTLLAAEHDSKLVAAIIFGGAAGSWEKSPKLQTRLTTAVDSMSVPVFFIYAANDYSVAPGKILASEMARLNKPHRLKIYAAIGRTTAEGHDFYYLGLSKWEPAVFAFLEKYMRR